MKNISLLNVTAVLFISSFSLTACGGSSNTIDEVSNVSLEDNSAIDSNNQAAELNSAEIDGLLFMREEEELARDLYLDIYDVKDSRLKTFKNISDKAETQHAEAIRLLLEEYQIADPSTGSRNTYSDSDLQDLYNNLINIAVGSDDLAAYRVGALVEETDIRDINTYKAQVSLEHQEIIDTYDNLLCGSRNHLRAFVKQIEKLTGDSYVIQVPELATEVLAILNSSREMCGNN